MGDNPMSRALPPSEAALAKLAQGKEELVEFARMAAQALADRGYPGSTTVLVDRRQSGKSSAPELDTGWDMGYYSPSTKEYPHLRRLFLLVDGSLAIDAIGKREKYSGPSSAWVKVQQNDRPELVPFELDTEVLGISDCQAVGLDLCLLVMRHKAITPELKQHWLVRS